jgi:hypothetical protein
MEIELRIYDIEPGLRWSWLQWFEQEFLPLHARLGVGEVLGRFLSYRDDATFAWFHGFRNAEERIASQETLWNHPECQAVLASAPVPVRKSIVRNLAPAFGSTITAPEQFRGMTECPVLEIRQYRIAPGQRARFATFFHDRTLEAQGRSGIRVHGQFNDLDDDNIFTWTRGFSDLRERDRSKADFYQSRLWLDDLEHEAFSMIEDYSNVLLVMPV